MKSNHDLSAPVLSNNVSLPERIGSSVTGALMLYQSIRKGSNIPLLAIGSYLMFRGVTGHCFGYGSFPEESQEDGDTRSRNINIKTAVTVNRPREEVYAFWRNFANIPLFMTHIEDVMDLKDGFHQWKAKIPGGLGTLEWKSMMFKDIPNERIGWQSLPGALIENAGNVHFRDAGKFGTEVFLAISYRAPGGKAGKGLGKMLNKFFKSVVKEDIRNFRRFLETGEIPKTKETLQQQPTSTL
jgi:uncharacterized membrane protein